VRGTAIDGNGGGGSVRQGVGKQGWRVLALSIAVLGVACEHGIVLRGQVNVPLEVQRAFSKESPGIVVMGGGFGGGTISAQLLAVLCEPTAAPLAIPFLQEQMGCAAEGTAWFKVTRLADRDRQSLACGIRQENFDALINGRRITVPDSFDKNKVVADAAVTIFRGKGGSCRNGDETISATVALAK
jgi:hypothetical protein